MPRKCSCGTQPVYNIPGETKPICCSKCKTAWMIDVVNKRCPCGKQPMFNMPGENIGVCCSKCKKPDMVDVVNKRCPCGKQPVYNMPGEKKGVCCPKCKTIEMINVVTMRCQCGKIPKFNVPGQTFGVCCSKCKTGDMTDVVNKKCSCGTVPIFNMIGETKPICCSKCKTGDMVDVVNKICPGYTTECLTRTYLSNGHKYCMSCDPNDARRKRYKRYEEEFFGYIKDKLDVHKREFRVSFGSTETSRKFARLDGIVFGDGVITCLEVDENGHQDYKDDEHRMQLVTAERLSEKMKNAFCY